MSKIASLSPDELLGVKKNIARKWGEIVEYKWTELKEKKAKDAKGSSEVDYEVVEQVDKYYVGKMDLKMTTGVVSILAAVFANGSAFKQLTGRTDNVAFVEFLDEYHLSALLSLIMGETPEWLKENWDTLEVIKVLKVFFKYNDFFALLKEVGSIGQSMNVDEETARKLALGQVASLAG